MDFLLISYKILVALLMLIFMIYVSDFRQKEKMFPIFSKISIILLKLFYVIPPAVFFYTAYHITSINYYDIVLPFLMVLGIYLVIKSKKDLGAFHTWAGFVSNKESFITRGIYSKLRHPLYTGIFIIIIFCNISIALHSTLILAIISFCSSSYLVVFLTLAAKKETNYLKKKFGNQFEEYCKCVNSFIPKII